MSQKPIWMQKEEKHQKEEEELEKLALTKNQDKLFSLADASACNEDENNFHAVHDGLLSGIGSRSKKEVWSIQLLSEDGTKPEWDVGNFLFFVGFSFEKVKAKIERLPDRKKINDEDEDDD